MELIFDSTTKASKSLVNVPKLSSPNFEMKNNYYVVTDGATFNYFVIKVLPDNESSPLIRFEKSPPVLLEGLAIVNKRVYAVPLKDLQRRIIRKSRDVTSELLNASTKSVSSSKQSADSTTTGAGSNNNQTVSNSDEQGTVTKAPVEINQDANITWDQQIGALLSFISEKEGEEWEITEAP